MNEYLALAITGGIYLGAMWLFIRWLGLRHEKELAEKRRSKLGPPDIDGLVRALEEEPGHARQSHLEAGLTIYMIDPANKEWLIKKLPDGTKQRVIFDAHGVEYVIEKAW